MKLTSGVRLGPYEIVAPIGAGGMGEVYRARDTRLDRTVAIKILPADFAQDAKLRIRFEREAKTISSLNHPHICALYDVGPDYLVMEHCEGKTLAKRIADGPLPIEQVLQYGIQIADALDKAHRQGIIHRDLKPSNIMLTRSGVKLLDFGLAKQRVDSSPEQSTIQQVTEEGKILGTIQYMAPEVLNGKEADARSDIFAVGLVLYEMVSGKPAFTGTSKPSLIAAILEREPPALQPTAPQSLDRLIRACLIKDPDERLQTAHDVLFELKWINEPATSASVQAARRISWLPWAAAALVMLLAVGLAFQTWKSRRQPSPGPRTFSILLPEANSLLDVHSSGTQLFVISPDGRYLVYVGKTDSVGGRQLFRRDINAGTVEPISGAEGGSQPFFSPDGRWIGFWNVADHKLRKVPINGGVPLTICGAGNLRGATWGAADVIVFGMTFSPLMRVSAAGGTPLPLTHLSAARKEATHRWPSFLPDGEHVLFTANENSGIYDQAKIEVVSMKTGTRQVVVDGASFAQYSAGHLLYARAGTVFAVPFDLDSRVVSGNAVPILNDAQEFNTTGMVHVTAGPDGSVYYVPRDPLSDRQIVWADRQGRTTPIGRDLKTYDEVRISPDGQKLLALVLVSPFNALWVYDLSRDSWRRLSYEGAKESNYPRWSPDGKEIIFASNKNGPFNIFKMPADGSSPPRQITDRQNWAMPYWSRSGTVVYAEQHPTTGWDIWTLAIDGHEPPKVFAASQSNELSAAFSPDGQWIVYSSNESGRHEVYVEPYPGRGKKWAISSEGGTGPRWRGQEVFFRNEDKMMVSEVKTEPSFVASKPRMLFETPFASYDVTPDGRRFALVQYLKKPSPPRQINVVLGALEAR